MIEWFEHRAIIAKRSDLEALVLKLHDDFIEFQKIVPSIAAESVSTLDNADRDMNEDLDDAEERVNIPRRRSLVGVVGDDDAEELSWNALNGNETDTSGPVSDMEQARLKRNLPSTVAGWKGKGKADDEEDDQELDFTAVQPLGSGEELLGIVHSVDPSPVESQVKPPSSSLQDQPTTPPKNEESHRTETVELEEDELDVSVLDHSTTTPASSSHSTLKEGADNALNGIFKRKLLVPASSSSVIKSLRTSEVQASPAAGRKVMGRIDLADDDIVELPTSTNKTI
jgi:hypothetical protein